MEAGMDTRERLLDAATRLFAERGYYGASISNIADELQLTKQALLHHFGSKGKVYIAAVTRQAVQIRSLLAEATETHAAPEDQLDAFFLSLCGFGLEDPDQLLVFVREIIDQQIPAKTSGVQDILETLVTLVQATDRWKGRPAAEAMAVVCQCFGAVQFFLSTEVAQGAVFGSEAYEAARDTHYGLVPATVGALVR